MKPESHRSGLNRRPLHNVRTSTGQSLYSSEAPKGGRVSPRTRPEPATLLAIACNSGAVVPRGTSAKVCARCKQSKALDAFASRTRRGKRTTQPYCRPCAIEAHTEWRHGKGKETFAKSNAASRDRYPERERARNAVANALRSGKLERGTACELEGGDCSGILEAHHDDYSKPLEVRWVCRGHHRLLDRERQAFQALRASTTPENALDCARREVAHV